MTSHPIKDDPQGDRDDHVLALGHMDRSLAALLCAINEPPLLDQPRLRGDELERLDELEAAVRAEGALSPFDFDRRLAVVRRWRAQVADPTTPAPHRPAGNDMRASNPATRDEHDKGLPPRRCGRCRQPFDGDPTLPPGSRAAFWLCPACRAILLPGR